MITVLVPIVVVWEALREESVQDVKLSRIRANLLTYSTNQLVYSLEGQKLLYQGQFVLLRSLTLIPHLLQEFHDITIEGIRNAKDTSPTSS